MRYSDDMGMERTPNESQHRINSGEENSPFTPARYQTRNLMIMSKLLYQLSYHESQMMESNKGSQRQEHVHQDNRLRLTRVSM